MPTSAPPIRKTVEGSGAVVRLKPLPRFTVVLAVLLTNRRPFITRAFRFMVPAVGLTAIAPV